MQSDILETIVTQRRLDVAAAKAATGDATLRARIESTFPSAPINLCERLRSSKALAVAAEFKRASPSKGEMVPLSTPVAPHAAAYTAGGATILSVLTEPTWFRGTLDDMAAARAQAAATAAELGAPRPVILRKDFIIDRYQILEARAYGADTLLLIVSSLPTVEQLQPLIAASRELGMEPLVEVNSVDEMRVAMAAGSRVVGINNRNLRTFKVDMGATVSVVAFAAAECARTGAPLPALLSLSGIRSTEDITALTADCITAASASGVRADVTLELMRGFLIGEAIMRSADPRAMVADLVAAAAAATSSSASSQGNGSSALERIAKPVRGKICGVKSVDGAMAACRSGADAVGMILVPGSPRCADAVTAQAIVAAVRKYREQDPSPILTQLRQHAASGGTDLPSLLSTLCTRQVLLMSAMRRAKPLTVGVFMNQPLDDVSGLAAQYGLDLIQLHGDEDPSAVAAASLPCPLLKVVHVPLADDGSTDTSAQTVAAVADKIVAWAPVAAAILLDSKVGTTSGGGTGAVFDASAFLPALERHLASLLLPYTASSEMLCVPVMLAGGLGPDNVSSQLKAVSSVAADGPVTCVVWAVDVSSGVEYVSADAMPAGLSGKGHKDPARVSAFLAAAKSV